MSLEEKGLRCGRVRVNWDDLGCFRLLDVRLLFGEGLWEPYRGVRSRVNQARANCQSRRTVRTDVFNASADSSSLIPAKYRSSTTFAWRGAIRDSASKASSRSRMNLSGCDDTTAVSFISILTTPPPRLPQPRVRAASTRIRRINWADS